MAFKFREALAVLWVAAVTLLYFVSNFLLSPKYYSVIARVVGLH